MAQTIRDYVLRRLALNAKVPKSIGGGASLERIWRDAQDAFPHRAPGWNYVQRLACEFDKTSWEEERDG